MKAEKISKDNMTTSHFINKWLGEFHGTDLKGVLTEHPEWVDKPDSRAFYREYAVTQEQHDEWYEWAIESVMKTKRYSRKMAKKAFTFDYLNCAPGIK